MTRPCMNPASILFPERDEPFDDRIVVEVEPSTTGTFRGATTLSSQSTARSRDRAAAIEIISPRERTVALDGIAEMRTDQILAAASAFVANVVAMVSPAELAEIKRRNSSPEYGAGSCATHDFFDANDAMGAAFLKVVGREVDISDADAALWSAAWNAAMPALSFPNVREAFPDFDTMPAIPADWHDISWRNDACPSFRTPNGFIVFVDYADKALRECDTGERFNVQSDPEVSNHNETVFASDDWSAVLDFVRSQP